MSKKILALLIVFAMCGMCSAYTHTSTVTQSGNGNVANVDQQCNQFFDQCTLTATQSGNNNQLYATQGGVCCNPCTNQSYLYQDGNNNYAEIAQNGTDNYAYSEQNGNNNELNLDQGCECDCLSVLSNQSYLYQNGNHNDAYINQNGLYNYAYSVQSGIDNYLDLDQGCSVYWYPYNVQSISYLYQQGNQNDADISQNGTNTYAYSVQSGNHNELDLYQGGYLTGSPGSAYLYQQGNHNTAYIDQVKREYVKASQSGNENYAEVRLRGDTHSADIEQTGNNNDLDLLQY